MIDGIIPGNPTAEVKVRFRATPKAAFWETDLYTTGPVRIP